VDESFHPASLAVKQCVETTACGASCTTSSAALWRSNFRISLRNLVKDTESVKTHLAASSTTSTATTFVFLLRWCLLWILHPSSWWSVVALHNDEIYKFRFRVCENRRKGGCNAPEVEEPFPEVRNTLDRKLEVVVGDLSINECTKQSVSSFAKRPRYFSLFRTFSWNCSRP